LDFILAGIVLAELIRTVEAPSKIFKAIDSQNLSSDQKLIYTNVDK